MSGTPAPAPASRLAPAVAAMLFILPALGALLPAAQSSFTFDLQRELLAWGAYLWILAGQLRQTPAQEPGNPWALLLAAVVPRVVYTLAWPMEFPGSTDIVRYIWEGQAVLAGISPHSHPASDAIYDFMRDPAVYAQIHYPAIPSPYPPAAQWLFASGSVLGNGTVSGFKLAYWAADLLLLLSVKRLLRNFNLPASRIWLVALNPLLLRYAYLHGHFDIVPVALLAAALSLLLAPKKDHLVGHHMDLASRVAAGALLGFSGGMKIFAIFLAPFLVRRLGKAGVMALVIALAIPLIWGVQLTGLGWTEGFAKLGEGLNTFSLFMRANAGPVPDGLLYITQRFMLTNQSPTRWAQRAAALLLAGLMVAFLWKGRSTSPSRLMQMHFTLGALFALSTLCNAWYFVWALPFAVLAASPAWLALMALSLIAYTPTTDLHTKWLLRQIEWWPFLLMMAWEARRWVRGDFMGAAAPPRSSA